MTGAAPERLVPLVLAALGALLASAACRSEQQPSEAAAPAPLPTASVRKALPVQVSPRPLPAAPCRLLRVEGDVRDEAGTAVAEMAGWSGTTWLELGAKSRVVVRHAKSARELTLRGPARALPCRDGAEQVLLERGTLESAPGTGVRPGAELWIATPFGTARYGDADLSCTVASARFRLEVRGGDAWTEPALRTRRGAQGRVAAGDQAIVEGSPSPTRLAERCEIAARAARASADRLLAVAASGIGAHAVEQLRQRRTARAACAMAAAAAIRANGAQRARLVDQIARADALWRAPPAAAELPQK